MDLTPYLETFRRQLVATAEAGGPEVSRAADLLATSLEASARLCLMQALADAADEVTSKLSGASVEVRLRGGEAELVVTELPAEPAPAATPPPAEAASGDVARVTLRLPEHLKDAVERAATAEGISVNAWLVRAITHAVAGRSTPPGGSSSTFPPGRIRISGFARA
ncbi:MAG TPA: toxin-antitoxin system HicB family antitoxin [Natronosporangium sp.]|nr:toxin-antitoxin system HicB family antitoxin [Natronosporangium sp.]